MQIIFAYNYLAKDIRFAYYKYTIIHKKDAPTYQFILLLKNI